MRDRDLVRKPAAGPAKGITPYAVVRDDMSRLNDASPDGVLDELDQLSLWSAHHQVTLPQVASPTTTSRASSSSQSPTFERDRCSSPGSGEDGEGFSRKARAYSPVGARHPDMETLRKLRPDVTPTGMDVWDAVWSESHARQRWSAHASCAFAGIAAQIELNKSACDNPDPGSPLISPVMSRTSSVEIPDQSEQSELLSGWIRRFHSRQAAEDQPWILCDSTKDHSYVSTTIKGARVSNEDTTFSDGRFFSLFDGHGGKAAARVGRDQLAKHFHDLMKSGNRSAPAPKPVQALHEAFVRTQQAMPCRLPECNAGATAIACWLDKDNNKDGVPLRIYVACAGDSQAIVFNSLTGEIPEKKCRLWDAEMKTLDTTGEEGMLPYETTPHQCTGGLVRNEAGKALAMENDPTGVGMREYQLLRRQHRFSSKKEVRCLSNMVGEARWRILDLEPTRALGHSGKAMGPLKSPEIYEWEITNPGQELLLMCCDGFFSKNAFRSPQHLVAFLVNPMDYCHRSDFFHGTCCAAFLKELREPLPSPEKCKMSSLFKFIYSRINDKLSDATWRQAHDSAYEFLSEFAAQNPIPNIRTYPAKTLLAASYLAVLLVGDDNISTTLVTMDDHKTYGSTCFELGQEPE